MKIFVSYTMRDGWLSLERLRQMETALSGLGDPYIDLLHNRSFHKQTFVERALASADLFIGCWTPGFSLSPWVQFELEVAQKRQMPTILVEYRMLHEWVGGGGRLLYA
jgi:hypothetical protein